jgi:hypothetical protein
MRRAEDRNAGEGEEEDRVSECVWWWRSVRPHTPVASGLRPHTRAAEGLQVKVERASARTGRNCARLGLFREYIIKV